MGRWRVGALLGWVIVAGGCAAGGSQRTEALALSESERPERVAPVRRPAVQQAVEPEQEGECVQALEAFEAEAEPAAELRARVADACPCYGEEDYGEFLLCWGWRPFECEEFPYHPQCAPVEFTVPSDPDT